MGIFITGPSFSVSINVHLHPPPLGTEATVATSSKHAECCWALFASGTSQNSSSGWQVRFHHSLGLFTKTDLAGRKWDQEDPGGKDGFDQVVLQPDLG